MHNNKTVLFSLIALTTLKIYAGTSDQASSSGNTDSQAPSLSSTISSEVKRAAIGFVIAETVHAAKAIPAHYRHHEQGREARRELAQLEVEQRRINGQSEPAAQSKRKGFWSNPISEHYRHHAEGKVAKRKLEQMKDSGEYDVLVSSRNNFLNGGDAPAQGHQDKKPRKN